MKYIKMFEQVNIPKANVGDYFLILYDNTAFQSEFKAKILEVREYGVLGEHFEFKCLFIDNQNKFHTNPSWVNITSKELIRRLTTEEIGDFEYHLNVKNYNL